MRKADVPFNRPLKKGSSLIFKSGNTSKYYKEIFRWLFYTIFASTGWAFERFLNYVLSVFAYLLCRTQRKTVTTSPKSLDTSNLVLCLLCKPLFIISKNSNGSFPNLKARKTGSKVIMIDRQKFEHCHKSQRRLDKVNGADRMSIATRNMFNIGDTN